VTDTQLYLAVGVPSFVALIGILVNVSLYIHLSSRMETRLTAMEGRFDLLMGKIVDVDNRLTRVEERLDHPR